jgi:hypothetical protein
MKSHMTSFLPELNVRIALSVAGYSRLEIDRVPLRRSASFSPMAFPAVQLLRNAWIGG